MKKNKLSIEMKVGVFMLLALSAIMLFVLIQARGGKYRGYDISAAFDYVSGLEVGSPVRVSGVRIGEVKGIEILYDAGPKVLVKMRIRQDVKIAKYSRLTIQTLGIIGEKYIEIAPSRHKEYVQPGDIIVGENPLSLERLAEAGQSIVIRLNDILEDIRNITGEEELQGDIKTFVKGAVSAIKNVDDAFERIENLSAEIIETNKSFQNILADKSPKIDELIYNTNALIVSGKDKMELTLDEIRELASAGRKSVEVFSDFSDTAREFKTVALGLQVLIEDASKEVKTTSLGIQEFLSRLQQEGLIARLMEEEDLLEQVKEEVVLLQEATKQFKTTAEDVSIFSGELNELLSNINEGKGTVGKFMLSDELYREIFEFVRDIKENPWKLLIRRRN